MAQITVKMLGEISENPDWEYYDLAGDVAALVPEMVKARITTKRRVAAFLATIIQETDRLKTLEEYGDEAYFRSFLGAQWRYHGRGYIMNTWLDAYRRLSGVLGVDLVNNPGLLATRKDLAAKAAVWFWTRNGIDPYADRGEFYKVSAIVNTGSPNGTPNHYPDRKHFYDRAMRILPDGFSLDAKEGPVPEKPKKGTPTAEDFWDFIDYLRPAIGAHGRKVTPYWVWEEGVIPNGPGAYAHNIPVPAVGNVIRGGIFCIGPMNLGFRWIGKEIPHKGDLSIDGGVAAYFTGRYGKGYFSEVERPFNVALAKKWADETGMAVLIGCGYLGMTLGLQGHGAWLLPKHTDGKYYVLQSFGGYAKWPGLNWDFTIEQSHAGNYYKVMVHPDDYWRYRGNERKAA